MFGGAGSALEAAGPPSERLREAKRRLAQAEQLARKCQREIEAYRKLVDELAPDDGHFLEHKMYGPITGAPWEKYRLALYASPAGNFLHTNHLDGREAIKRGLGPS